MFVSRFIKLRYNLGSGTGEARSNSSIDLNTWYTVSVNREDKNASLTVSGETPISVISPGTAVSLNVPSSFYLGGVPTLSAINPNAVDSFVQDFVGCIDMFMVCLSLLNIELLLSWDWFYSSFCIVSLIHLGCLTKLFYA